MINMKQVSEICHVHKNVLYNKLRSYSIHSKSGECFRENSYNIASNDLLVKINMKRNHLVQYCSSSLRLFQASA